MALCYKPNDVAVACDSADLNALSGGLLINVKAFKATKSTTKRFTLENITVVDPTTGAFPVVGSDYYPIKLDWHKNAVKPNYEPIERPNLNDTYAHTAGVVIVSNSESDKGKETVMALTSEKYVFVYEASGVEDSADRFHVLGAKNGLSFVVEPTSADYGGRVAGTLRSLEGAAEANPNGYNLLIAGGEEATKTLFNNRFNVAIV